MPVFRALVLLTLILLAAIPSGAMPIVGVQTGTAGFVGLTEFGPLDTPRLVTSYGEFIATFGASTAGLANPYLAPSVAGYFANGGTRLFIVRVASVDNATLIGVDGGPGSRTGLQALRDIDEVSVVAVPGVSAQTVQLAMIALCESEGERMAVLDPAASADVAAVLAQRAGLSSAPGMAALYFPWVQAAPAGVSLQMPPSGFIAAAFSRSDPPNSPVGTIATASGVSVTISAPEQDSLTTAGINAIRFFPGQGVQIWGARTLSSDPEWRYIAVRRTALFLEESIHEGTEWAVFEPNDAILWASLEQSVDDFMFSLYLSGWFQGSKPEDAYFVRVDASTMTQLDIDEGRTIILLGFAPLQPAEFVILRIVQQRETGTAVPSLERVSARLFPAEPNPFNPRTSLRFELMEAGPVDLRVYDLAGRRVRWLLRGGPMGVGLHRVSWDGRDGDGAPMASGVYVYRLRAGSHVESRRMTLLK